MENQIYKNSGKSLSKLGCKNWLGKKGVNSFYKLLDGSEHKGVEKKRKRFFYGLGEGSVEKNPGNEGERDDYHCHRKGKMMQRRISHLSVMLIFIERRIPKTKWEPIII